VVVVLATLAAVLANLVLLTVWPVNVMGPL